MNNLNKNKVFWIHLFDKFESRLFCSAAFLRKRISSIFSSAIERRFDDIVVADLLASSTAFNSIVLLDLGNEPVERRARSKRPLLSSDELADERRRRFVGDEDVNGWDEDAGVDFSLSLRLIKAPIHELMGFVISGVTFDETNLAAIFDEVRLGPSVLELDVLKVVEEFWYWCWISDLDSWWWLSSLNSSW